MTAARVILALLLLALAGHASVRAGGCQPEPASQDAPSGWYERGPTDDCPDPSCPCHDYARLVTP